MISKIAEIKNMGIFNGFVASANLSAFSKFNLIYGWNGSGKTTLSKLLRILETKQLDSSYKDCEFKIEIDGINVVKQTNLSDITDRVLVFNSSFIESNIDWIRQGLKSIVVISEGKIEERNRYFDLKENLIPIARSKYLDREKVFNLSLKERDDFLSSQAKSIKQSFQLIDTTDTRYLNYNKTKLQEFIVSNSDLLTGKNAILSEVDLNLLRQKVKPVQMPVIDFVFSAIAIDKFIEGQSKITNLLCTTVVSDIIKRLQEHDDLNAWVLQGLDLHGKYKSLNCEFCNQKLPDERIKAIEAHFNLEYKAVLEKLKLALIWLEEQNFSSSTPDAVNLYEELRLNYSNAYERLKIKESNVLIYQSELKIAIQNKLANPFELLEFDVKSGIDALEELLEARKCLFGLIEDHNQKTQNFQNELNNYKKQLELHYVAEAIVEKKYDELLKRIGEEEIELKEKSISAKGMEDEYQTLEAKLANVSKGAEDFNKHLHSFLGRTDISLEYDTVQKGYKITRTGSNLSAQNLSEGEKTAIAFVYFITKITENGEKVENTIIVVDDPISSFDSNHLFHSYSFLKQYCEKSKQLIVLTHNFQYFRMIRDWLIKKNDRNQPPKSSFYSLETQNTLPRSSAIKNAHSSLLKYSSEYHYLFNKLQEFKDKTNIDLDSSYQIANFSRKILEGFFAFKHPKLRNDFSQLMDAGCIASGVDPTIKEKVYRFINKYSHNQIIEFSDSDVDNLLAEGENITALVLQIICKSDENHFKEMMEICSN